MHCLLQTAAAGAEESPVAAAFNAVGAGTFLFVATCEVIPSEMSHNAADRAPKTISLVGGALAMGLLAKWA
jgi:zinc transporter ZupT